MGMSGTDTGVQRLNATLSGNCTRIVNPGQSSHLLACNSILHLNLNSEKFMHFTPLDEFISSQIVTVVIISVLNCRT